MPCTRGCTGVDLCSGARICCVSFDSATGCNPQCSGLAAGSARIGVNAQGNLIVSSFVGGQCQTREITPATAPSVLTDVPNSPNITHQAGGVTVTVDLCAKVRANCTDTLVANPDGSFTHTAVNGTVINIPAPIGASTLVVNPNTSTFTHTSGNGTVTLVDACQLIRFCTIGNLQNVAPGADTPNNGQALVWNATTNLWEPRGPDFITDEVNTDRFTHTGVNGATQVIALCNKIRTCTLGVLANTDPTVDAPTEGQVLTWNATTNLWEPRNPAAVVPDTLTVTGSVVTHTPINNGTPVNFDICAIVRANCTDTLVLDPATNSYIHTAVNGTVQTIPVCPGVGAIQNRLPTANDDACNTSGVGVLCPGSTFVYDPSIAGADVVANGACRRNFVNRGTNACGGAIWEEICQPVGPNQLQVGLNAPFNAPSNVLTVMQWQQEVTADPTGAVTYNPATGAFTINCPGQYEIHSSIMGPFIPYTSVIGQDNIEFVINTRINGAASRRLGQEFFAANGVQPTFPAVTGSGQYRLNTGDTLEILFFHNHNAALALQPLTNNDQHFTIRKTGC